MVSMGAMMLSEGDQAESSFVKGIASSYDVSENSLYPIIPKLLLVIIPIEILLYLYFPQISSSEFYWVIIGITIPCLAYSVVYWVVYRLVFVTSKPPRDGPMELAWSSFNFRGWGNEKFEGFFLESKIGNRDLVVYLHGYGSSLARGETRAGQFNDLGMNVISLDQRGFGTQGRRKDWTVLKAVTDVEGLLDHAPKVLGFKPKRLWIYGHSLGGFITLRLASHPSGWWKDSLRGIMLESPVASMPLLIEKKLPGRAALATHWVRHILRMEHERIHPDLGIRYSNAELPYSGIPIVPVLVLQSKNDSTLGNHHFLLIKEYISHISEIHILDMPHTSLVDVEERRHIVAEWMIKQSEISQIVEP